MDSIGEGYDCVTCRTGAVHISATRQNPVKAQLAILRGRDYAGEDATQTAEEPPVARGAWNQQIDIMKENNQKAQAEQDQHHDRNPAGTHRRRARCRRGVTGRGPGRTRFSPLRGVGPGGLLGSHPATTGLFGGSLFVGHFGCDRSGPVGTGLADSDQQRREQPLGPER